MLSRKCRLGAKQWTQASKTGVVWKDTSTPGTRRVRRNAQYYPPWKMTHCVLWNRKPARYRCLLKYLSNLPPNRIWQKVILMRGAMQEWRLPSSRRKNAWSRRYSPIGMLQAASNESIPVKQVLPVGMAPWDQEDPTKCSMPPTRGAPVSMVYCFRQKQEACQRPLLIHASH